MKSYSRWQIEETGGPEQLHWKDGELEPQGTQALVRNTAVGVNFIDTYIRSGLYPAPLPTGIGMEGAGIVEAVGPDATLVRVGDRVGYCTSGPGSYAEARLADEATLIPLPDGINDETAAAALLKGLTVCYLLRRTFEVDDTHTVLFHAAAGGVGLIFCQWAKALGARVIGTVGSAEKGELARANGCDEIILYREEEVAPRVRTLTGGRGVDVAYDAVGKDTYRGTLESIAPHGLFASFGNASGPPPAVNPMDLMQRGSLKFTRTSLFSYASTREDLLGLAGMLFEVIGNGSVNIHVNHRYPLSEAPQVHRDLEARRTTGSIVMLPGT